MNEQGEEIYFWAFSLGFSTASRVNRNHCGILEILKKGPFMDANPVVGFCERRHFSVKNFSRLAIIFPLPFIMAGKAAAQYGGGGGTSGGGSGSGNGTYVPPKGGYSSATGAAVGAGAAAGATGLFVALHYRGRVVGCIHESKNKSYALIPGDVYIKPGQRVQLKVQKSKNDGDQVFKAKKLLKDLGTCNSTTPETPKALAGQ